MWNPRKLALEESCYGDRERKCGEGFIFGNGGQVESVGWWGRVATVCSSSLRLFILSFTLLFCVFV